MCDFRRRVEKSQPSNSPKVAEEKARNEKPLSNRSINTTTSPSNKPSTTPGHMLARSSDEAIAPIAAQNVTNNSRSRLTVNSGVINGLRSSRAEAVDDAAVHGQSAAAVVRDILRRDRGNRLIGAARQHVAGRCARFIARARRGVDRSVAQRFLVARLFLSHFWAVARLALLDPSPEVAHFCLPPAALYMLPAIAIVII